VVRVHGVVEGRKPPKEFRLLVEWDSRKTKSTISLSDVLVDEPGSGLPATLVGWLDEAVEACQLPGVAEWWTAIHPAFGARPTTAVSESSSSEASDSESNGSDSDGS
jgi:hypothetical protein